MTPSRLVAIEQTTQETGFTMASLVRSSGAQSLPEAYRIRLSEAFRLAADIQIEIWPGWSEGRAEATDRTSTEWVLTLLHEHFHQLQTSQTGYYDAVAPLHLDGGDTSGMWMLDFAFPYEDAVVAARFRGYTQALFNALERPGGEGHRQAGRECGAGPPARRRRAGLARGLSLRSLLSVPIRQRAVAAGCSALRILDVHSPAGARRDSV